MTEPKISEEAKAKANELASAMAMTRGKYMVQVSDWMLAFEHFIQTTSDVAKEVSGACSPFDDRQFIKSLILPEPKDPLVDALLEIDLVQGGPEAEAKHLRMVLARRGLQITPIEGE